MPKKIKHKVLKLETNTSGQKKEKDKELLT